MKKYLIFPLIFCLMGCAGRQRPQEVPVPVVTVSDSRTDTLADVSQNTSFTTEPTSSEEVTMNPDRITYQPDFFYEPLSEDIRQRITGHSYPADCTIPYEELRYVSVQYYNFDHKIRTGEIICNQSIAQDLVEIFYALYQSEYPIEKIRLIDEYNADDELSCLDNNSSCFNYRLIAGTTRLSNHAAGIAIDINPLYNPYITWHDGVEKIFPYTATSYANRDADFIAKITHEDLCFRLFTEHGFTWGGDWTHAKDYQHFEKK